MKSTIKMIANQFNLTLKSRSLFIFSKKPFFWNKKTTTPDTTEKKEKILGEKAKKDIENSQDDFKDYLTYLIKFNNFTWNDYYKMLLEKYKASNSFTNKMRGIKEDKSTVDLCNKLNSALFDHEKTKINFTETEQKSLSQVTGISIDNIKSIIFNYVNIKLSHAVIKEKEKKNEHLPRSYYELQKMMSELNTNEFRLLQEHIQEDVIKRTGKSKEELSERQQEILRYNAKKVTRTRNY